MPKVDFDEMNRRKREIYFCEILNVPRQVQWKFAKENWNISSSTLDNYRREAHQQIKEDFEKIAKNSLQDSLLLRRAMIYEAIAQNDLRLAFDVLRDTDRLMGHYPTITQRNLNLNLDIPDVDLDRLNDEQLRQLANGTNPQIVLSSNGNT
jgi:hypothetical protein